MVIEKACDLSLRPLERNDLRFVHELNNDAKIMRYWFEEPYETFTELSQLYDRHVHDQRERRFICENDAGEAVGLVELMELNYIHRRGEFQIIIAPGWQGHGYRETFTNLYTQKTAMMLFALGRGASMIEEFAPKEMANSDVFDVWRKPPGPSGTESAVQVDEEQGQTGLDLPRAPALVGTVGPVHRVVQPVVQQHAVGHAGERIGQHPLGRLPLGGRLRAGHADAGPRPAGEAQTHTERKYGNQNGQGHRAGVVDRLHADAKTGQELPEP